MLPALPTANLRVGKPSLLMVLALKLLLGLVNTVDDTEWPCLPPDPLGNFGASILTNRGDVPTFFLTFLRAEKEVDGGVTQSKIY